MDIKLHVLEAITDEFSDEKKVGNGGYGVVYRGMYNGKEIAVKKLHSFLGLDDKDFDNEFRNLSKVHHENVVQLIGYCHESRVNYIKHKGELTMATIKERILCFDYMQGGSLDSHITDEMCNLDWPTCYKIITGTCEGLNHLHSADEKPILHMDLKPANILLDENMTAKIADLGLSRLVNSTQTHRTMVASFRGTPGYMPPEYIDEFAISTKFDVYSLGAIIIRIMDGKNGHTHFVEMGTEKFIEKVIENWKERLPRTSEDDNLRVKTCTEIAIRCVDKDRKRRPCTKDIVQELKELEAKIHKMSLHCGRSKDLIGQISSGSTIVSVDPCQELCFLLEPRKDVSSCLKITNITEDFVAFSIKTNKQKYCAQPNIGVMPPCSNYYIRVTLRVQDETPPNMQCRDVFVVQSACVSEDFKFSSHEKPDVSLEGKVVHMITLPIFYVITDQFPGSNM